MTPMADREVDSADIVNATTELQGRARANSQSPTAVELRINFQVVHLVGAARAWRLIEVEGSGDGSMHRRRMLCLASADQVRDALAAIEAWVRADREFCAAYMVTPGGFPGVTADWVHRADFDGVFGPLRQLLRKDSGWTILASFQGL